MGRPELPEAEVVVLGETVVVKDCPVVVAASKLSFCGNCAPLACVVFVVLIFVLAAEVTAGAFSVVPCVVCDVALGDEDVGLLVVASFVALAAAVVSTDAVDVVACEVLVVTDSPAFDVTAEAVVLTVVV